MQIVSSGDNCMTYFWANSSENILNYSDFPENKVWHFRVLHEIRVSLRVWKGEFHRPTPAPHLLQNPAYGVKGPLIVQSTLVISNSKGLFEILRDIRSSTYQVCRIEEKIIWLTTFNKLIGNWTFEVRDILKILWKRGEIAPKEQFLLFSTIFSICC